MGRVGQERTSVVLAAAGCAGAPSARRCEKSYCAVRNCSNFVADSEQPLRILKFSCARRSKKVLECRLATASTRLLSAATSSLSLAGGWISFAALPPPK